ncbi:MAG TPA: 16S rRNA (adenine(1518)-N(6)/adenine(1519)-N(6))-dimethyltransferase RsmA [Solirubrobacteraceae bacterium]|nr:16S rRNA (adenine(1518)-N(6)/adenine(1519)-N(6))-dimethyltransferase RsmA [Solirubrobacteraceae bacterium]
MSDARPSGRASRSPSVTAREPSQPTQPSLRRLQRFDIHPDRELGQNFLIDSNILGVIERAAELSERDVVLEVGGGLGVLSEYLAERVVHVHVVEIDTRLREALLDATDPHPNVSVHWGDAMRIDLAGLDPAPEKVVANLPYGIAAGALLRTVEELPDVGVWVAMAQREVGERLAAAPGGRDYGVSSVIAQLACEVRVLRAIPRAVFYPEPNVDSVLVRMRRLRAAPSPALRALVGGAFAHRRKTLAGSLALVGRGGGAAASEEGRPAGRASPPAGGRSREEIRLALSDLGHPENVRAERLEPEDFRELGRLLEI